MKSATVYVLRADKELEPEKLLWKEIILLKQIQITL